MKKKTILWLLIFAAVILGGLLLYRHLSSAGGTVAVISVDGEVRERIDLSKIRESYDLEIVTAWGRNTVHVAPGAISVTEADCPDQICVKMGQLTGGGIPIVCMPHRLVIEIEGGDIDA
ncbi:MAG: NusG domain II-containing protein [Oscillospiraceae bacterium]|nr:NusG domain II-containing protein [Oscillospiraceae bacterium]